MSFTLTKDSWDTMESTGKSTSEGWFNPSNALHMRETNSVQKT